MKKIYFIIGTIIISANSWSQPAFAWMAGFNTTSSQEGTAITLDNLNNVYTIGVYQGAPDFDPGAGVSNLPWSGGSNFDVFICKLDANKNFVWANKITGNGTAGGVTIDINGDVLIAGTFSGTQDFDPGAGTFSMNSGIGGGCYVTKLNSSGNFIWAKQFSAYRLAGVATDAAANVLLTGDFVFGAELDPSAATYSLTSAGGSDSYVLKLNSSGNFVWGAQVASGTSNESSTGIKVDAVGDVYFSGYFRSQNCDFDPSASTFTMSSASATTDDIFISKLDASGNLVWAKRIGNTNNDYSYAIAVDNANDVLITGYFFGNVDFDPGAATYNILSGGGGSIADIYILKLNSSGSFVWAKNYASGQGKSAYAITTDANRNVYTTGYIGNSPTDFDPGPGTVILTPTNLSDIYIAALDVSGNYKWAGLLIGSTNATQQGQGIVASSTGEFYSTGKIYSVTDFNPGAGSLLYGTNAGPCAYIQKMNSCTGAPTTPAAIIGATVVCSGITSSYSIALVSGATGYSWNLPASWTGTSTTNSIAATSGSAGIFSVTANNACGTSAQRTLNVIVNPTPTISVNSGAICSGDSFTLVTTGATTYTYSGGSPVVSPTVTSSYSVAGTSSAGCISSIAAISSITVNPLPTISGSTSNSLLCTGQTATLTASGASTYTWNPGGTGTNISISPTITSTYTLNGTDANGCINSAAITQSVSACTGIFEFSTSSSELIIYPNPTNEKLTITSSRGDQLVEIYNAIGQSVHSSRSENKTIEIDLSKESNGIYFVKVGTVIRKIIKN